MPELFTGLDGSDSVGKVSVVRTPLRCPYPWFGGKSDIAHVVWDHFGGVQNYVEPFFGSGAVLLNCPFDVPVETINDKDGYLANFWRAVKHDPVAVAEWADNPVNENDMHARHAWLVNRKNGFYQQLEADPGFFDAKVAGWWVWGICCWIGRDWCSGTGPWNVVEMEDGTRQLVHLGNGGTGVNRQLVHLSSGGMGVNRQLVHLDGNRGDANVGNIGLLAWMQALADRMRHVRVCCGDWKRVCGGSSGDALAIFKAGGGKCGVFLDPPYPESAERTMNLYNEDCGNVAHEAAEWAVRHGDDADTLIAFCGYEGSHNFPESWRCIPWKARGGYSMTDNAVANAARERVWFSPSCYHGGKGYRLMVDRGIIEESPIDDASDAMPVE